VYWHYTTTWVIALVTLLYALVLVLQISHRRGKVQFSIEVRPEIDFIGSFGNVGNSNRMNEWFEETAHQIGM